MIPAVLAARPIIKYGVLVGVPVALFLAWSSYVYFKGYGNGKEKAEAVCQESVNKAMALERGNAKTQILAQQELNKRIFDDGEKKAAAIQALLDDTRKKARKYANVKIQVPMDILSVHDQYAGMSAGPRRDSAGTDPGARGTEVSSRALPTEANQRVSVSLGEIGTVEMTVEQATNMLTDVYNTLSRMENDYAKFSAWNDGREAIEWDLIKKGMP